VGFAACTDAADGGDLSKTAQGLTGTLMKILDKYIIKNFLVGYLIAFLVLIGLIIIIDLFVNLDEFAEHSNLGVLAVAANIVRYYGIQSTVYFRDFAGMITVIAAAFSLGRMTRANELTAVLASGVSLKRVIAPIITMAILFTGVLVIDQEFIIPNLADTLVLKRDVLPGQDSYSMWFIGDKNGSLINSSNFDAATATMKEPTIIIRSRQSDSLIWDVSGKISATSATYNPNTQSWDLKDGIFLARQEQLGRRSVEKSRRSQLPQRIESYQSDITPQDIPILRKEKYMGLLSSKQLSDLAARSSQVKDLTQLYSQKHFRITDPMINLIMLLVGLPVLVCREPKAMKSAIMASFGITVACFLVTFLAKLVATEVIFNRVIPEFWAWLPIFIFLPIAFIEIDSMKT
jgi:lipopolysaccharide export system permease protein